MKITKLSMEVRLLDGPQVPHYLQLHNEALIVATFEDGSGKSISILSDRDGQFDSESVAAAFKNFGEAIANKHKRAA